MSRTPLGPGAEFDVIRRILADAAPAGPGVAVGPGDDCALIEAGDGYLAVGVDLAVEGVHFLASWGAPERAGERAVLTAVSDLAAMAAEPLAALVALSVPDAEGPEFAALVGRGCRLAAERVGAGLAGGDLSRGGAALVLDVTVLGRVDAPLLRSGARPGDEIWVTGRLGAAAAAVRAWKGGDPVSDEWRERFWRPTPRLREARWLVDRGASAGLDLSDGLLADAGHLAAASQVAIEIDASAVPAAPGVDAQLALTGGDDYELLIAAPVGILGAEAVREFRHAFDLPLTRVGRAVVGRGVRSFRAGKELRFASPGHDHFRPGSSASSGSASRSVPLSMG